LAAGIFPCPGHPQASHFPLPEFFHSFRGERGDFLGGLDQKSPPPPFDKGGPKATGGEFLQPCLERFLIQ